jgi:GntR family transcriptional regulator
MEQPLLIVNHGSTVPPYEQVSLQLRMLIASRQLVPGAPLPPVRQLAADLGVAPNTIMRAYDELEHDGWVIREARKNVAVAPVPPSIHEERGQRLERAVAELLDLAYLLDATREELYTELEHQLEKDVSRMKGS